MVNDFTITNKIGLNEAKCDDASALKINFYQSFVVDYISEI